MRRGSVGAGVLALSLAALPASAEEAVPAEAPLDVILARAGAYVLRYGDSFRNLAAEEAYRQAVSGGGTVAMYGNGGENAGVGEGLAQLANAESYRAQVRNLRSDIVFVQLGGPIPWYTFRDVYLVDGSKVQDRSGRLERLFASPSPSAREQARAILAESTRYNLGGVHRNVNSPTIALLFLLPANQARLIFQRKDGKTIAGFRAVEVAFRESVRPTLVKDSWGNDVPASGSFWIDPSRGTVLRTDIDYHDTRDAATPAEKAPVIASIQTRYRREAGLDIFVPDAMRERYRTVNGGHIDGEARYHKYRRFQVTSEWEVTNTARPAAEGR
jgi:hypothetical protein